MSIHIRSELRAEIRRLIKDTSSDTTRQRWTDAVLNNRIDWANEDVVVNTACLQSRITTDITSGTAEYTLPADFLYAQEIKYKNSDGNWNMLQQITFRQLDLSDADWEGTNGTPSHYYIRRNVIGLYPNPDTSRTAALRIDYVERPDDLAGDTSYPYNAVTSLYPFHDLVVLRVAARCKEDEGVWVESDKLLGRYYAGIKQMTAKLGERFDDLRIMNIYEKVRAGPRRTR